MIPNRSSLCTVRISLNGCACHVRYLPLDEHDGEAPAPSSLYNMGGKLQFNNRTSIIAPEPLRAVFLIDSQHMEMIIPFSLKERRERAFKSMEHHSQCSDSPQTKSRARICLVTIARNAALAIRCVQAHSIAGEGVAVHQRRIYVYLENDIAQCGWPGRCYQRVDLRKLVSISPARRTSTPRVR